MRNPFARIFGRQEPEPRTDRLAITGSPATFSRQPFTADPYQNDLFRSGVDAIARVAAKFVLQPRARFSDGSEADADDRLARLLQVRPNDYMTAYDLLYQVYTHLFLHNNSYLYLHRVGGEIVGLYPLHVATCDMVTAADGKPWCAFTFANGTSALLPYADVVHLRRHFNRGDVAGDSNAAISAGVELAEAQNAGIRQAIAQGGQIRGIVKYAGSLGPSKLAAYQRAFNETQLQGNNSGVIISDAAAEFVPVTDTAPAINPADLEATRQKIFGYLGINAQIVDSTFTDDVFGAFDESVIEPLALATSLEFTSKVYTPGQVARGRRIECSTARIRYVSVEGKTKIIAQAAPLGALTINEVRDLLGLPRVDDGDRRLQSLNYAATSLVDEYQLFVAQRGIRSTLEPENAQVEGADHDES